MKRLAVFSGFSYGFGIFDGVVAGASDILEFKAWPIVLEIRCFFEAAVLQLRSARNNRVASFHVQIDIEQPLARFHSRKLREMQLVFMTQHALRMKQETLDGAADARQFKCTTPACSSPANAAT